MQRVPCPACWYGLRWTACVLLAGVLGLAGCSSDPATHATQQGPTLSAAASLQRVLPSLIAAFEQTHGAIHMTVNYGGSGGLRQQVQSGAPVDAVLFAAARDVDQLVEQGLVDPTTRHVIARNEILLVGPTGGSSYTFRTLGKLPDNGKLAIGDPDFVPAGRYARQALEQLGRWSELRGQLVYGGDVTRVLAYARRGEVDAAVVYRTDVIGIDGLQVLDDGSWEGAPQPVVVAAATVIGSDNNEIRSFLSFLGSPPARTLWTEHGFQLP